MNPPWSFVVINKGVDVDQWEAAPCPEHCRREIW